MDELLEFEDNSQKQNELPAHITERIINKDDDWYYNDKKYVTNSMLSELKKSPLHLNMYLNKTFSQEDDHHVEGKAFHCAILEPHEFNKRFFCLDDSIICQEIGGAKPRGTNKYKEWKELRLKEAGDKTIIPPAFYEDLMRMQDKLLGIQELRNLIALTAKESIMHDEYISNNGKVKRKIKLDAIRYGDFFFDLKSTKDPVGKFNVAFRNFDYDRQMAYYKDVSKCETGFVIAVEKTFPYSVGFFEVTDETFNRGRDKYEHLMEQYIVGFHNKGIKNFDTYYTRSYL